MINIVLYVFGAFILFQVVVRLARRWFAPPAPSWIAPFLKSPTRKLIQPPGVVMSRSGIEEGMKVLEVGCGNGLFALEAARTVGENGFVLAYDIQRSMLKLLHRELNKRKSSRMNNVVLVQGDAQALPFAGSSFDAVFIVAALPEVPDPGKALLEVRRVLKPGGTVAVSEFLVDPDYPRRSTTVRWGVEAGFRLEEMSGNFFSYTARFKKENDGR